MQAGVKSAEVSSDAWEASVSAWVDGAEPVRTEDLDSPYGRQLWDTYHLIGDVLRSEELAIKPSDLLYARISKAIDAEPAIVAPRRHKIGATRAGLSGLAVAAAVVTFVWVALPYFSSGVDQGATQIPVMAASDEAIMKDYVNAHRQYAGANPIRQVSFEMGAPK